MLRDQNHVAILALHPSPRSPFVIETARAMRRAAGEDAMRDVWRGAVAELTDPLVAAGMPFEDVKRVARSFGAAVEVALASMNGGDGGPPGTRHPVPRHRRAA